jgi:hypothetical protein
MNRLFFLKFKKSFFIGFTVIIVITNIAVVYSKNNNQVLKTTSQEPQYITQAKKDIIGVWYAEENPTYIWEFKENGTLVSRSDGNPARIQTFKIVNTTPICGQDVEVDESKETMYLVTKDANNLVHCDILYFKGNQNQKMHLWSVGGRLSPDAITVFIKKSKTRVEKF